MAEEKKSGRERRYGKKESGKDEPEHKGEKPETHKDGEGGEKAKGDRHMMHAKHEHEHMMHKEGDKKMMHERHEKEMKEIADGMSRSVKIRTREGGEIVYESDRCRRTARKR